MAGAMLKRLTGRDRRLLSLRYFLLSMTLLLGVEAIEIFGEATPIQDALVGKGVGWTVLFAVATLAVCLGRSGHCKQRTALSIVLGVVVMRLSAVLWLLITLWPDSWPTLAIGGLLWALVAVNVWFAIDETEEPVPPITLAQTEGAREMEARNQERL